VPVKGKPMNKSLYGVCNCVFYLHPWEHDSEASKAPHYFFATFLTLIYKPPDLASGPTARERTDRFDLTVPLKNDSNVTMSVAVYY
jgi:hypothetical protein